MLILSDFAKSLVSSSANFGDVKDMNILKDLRDIKNSLDFSANVDYQKIYTAIPVNINGEAKNAELYVFRDKKNRNGQNGQSSVLIALDFAELRRVEIFISKVADSLSFQIKSDRPATLAAIGGEFEKLKTMLSAIGYSVSNVSLLDLSERFTVLSEPNNGGDGKEPALPKRYSFDMRV
ncbi:hypothetical protein AGMMS49975_30010 [Clostridia bacterium]|nr:hypothetical protein AGMMS49975_30010 [Clostridia bacterium]